MAESPICKSIYAIQRKISTILQSPWIVTNVRSLPIMENPTRFVFERTPLFAAPAALYWFGPVYRVYHFPCASKINTKAAKLERQLKYCVCVFVLQNMGPYSHPPNDPSKDQMLNSVVVCTDGRLILEFTFDDLTRIKSWHFSTRHYQELISKRLVALQAQQDPSMLEQITKNITRQGLTNSTLNYLRVRLGLSGISILTEHTLVVCHPWAHARVDVPTQGICTDTAWLFEDNIVPEVATYGGTAGNF